MFRFQPTHLLTATRAQSSVDTDEYGTPLPTSEETVVADEPVELAPGGTEFVRAETGEEVRRADTVIGNPELMELRGGDTVSLASVTSGELEHEELEVRSVQPEYEGTDVWTVTIELEGL